MFVEGETKPRSKFRNPLLYTSTLFVIIVLYVGWVFFSRWQENRDAEQQAAAKKRAQDQRIAEAYASEQFEIQSFYANPGVIHRGESSQLCYGVAKAKTVRLDPPSSGAVWPSYARCVDVSPTKSTNYTLTAEDAAGNTRTATLEVEVR